MPRPARWTDGEIDRLRHLYTSEVSFEEIIEAFPNRTSNAIRLKASRLGLRRPTIPTTFLCSSTILICSEGDGSSKGYLFRCSECSSWIQLKEGDNEDGGVIVCGNCGAKCYFVT